MGDTTSFSSLSSYSRLEKSIPVLIEMKKSDQNNNIILVLKIELMHRTVEKL